MLPSTHLYAIKDPAHFHAEMLRDVQLLWQAGAFPSCVTLIACFIDAMAAGNGSATKAKFKQFMERHFRALCDELHAVAKAKPGAITFYEQYRNGLAHLRGPKSHYALTRHSDTGGKYVEFFDVARVGRFVGINVDRLHSDFLAAVNSFRKAGHP
jgi:hypothetical protein